MSGSENEETRTGVKPSRLGERLDMRVGEKVDKPV